MADPTSQVAISDSDAVEPGECPEWQRELTANQPPHGFEGSSPSSPTSLCSLRELRLGKPARLSRSERAKAAVPKPGRAKAGSPPRATARQASLLQNFHASSRPPHIRPWKRNPRQIERNRTDLVHRCRIGAAQVACGLDRGFLGGAIHDVEAQ